MWITYVQNLDKEKSAFQYVRSFLKPEVAGNNSNYNIEKVLIDEDETFPLKVFNFNNSDLICYCCKNIENITSLNDLYGQNLSNSNAVVSLKFVPDTSEDYDKFYEFSSLPTCDSSFYQAAQDLAVAASSFGIPISNFQPSLNSSFRFEIESKSILELLSDVEVFKFLSSTIFRSIHGKFLIPRSSQEDSLWLEIFFKKSLSKKEKENIENLTLEAEFLENSVKFITKNPDLNVKKIVEDILSCFNHS